MLNRRLDISSSETDLSSHLFASYDALLQKILQHLDLLCQWQPGTNFCKASSGEKHSHWEIALQEQHGPSPSFAWKEPSSIWPHLTKAYEVLSCRPWGEKHKTVCIHAAEVSPPWRWWVSLPIGNYTMDDIVRAWTSGLVLLVHIA